MPEKPPPPPPQVETGIPVFEEKPTYENQGPPSVRPIRHSDLGQTRPALSGQQIAIIVCSVIGMVGTFLPWASMGPFSIDGTAGDGWITFVLFLITMYLGTIELKTRVAVIPVALLASGIAIWKIMDIQNIKGEFANEAADDPFGVGELISQSVQVGAGLFVIAGAGVLLIIAAVSDSPPEARKRAYQKYLRP